MLPRPYKVKRKPSAVLLKTPTRVITPPARTSDCRAQSRDTERRASLDHKDRHLPFLGHLFMAPRLAGIRLSASLAIGLYKLVKFLLRTANNHVQVMVTSMHDWLCDAISQVCRFLDTGKAPASLLSAGRASSSAAPSSIERRLRSSIAVARMH